MEMASASHRNPRNYACWWWLLKDLPDKTMNKVIDISGKAKKLEQEDLRRIIHSLKVELALTLVSLLYYVNLLYNFFRDSGVWAIFTVIFFLESTVGKLANSLR